MKNIFKLLLFTSLLFVSCDDNLLEPFTPGALTEDVAITTSTNLRNLMNSTNSLCYDREQCVFTSVFTDEAGIGFANGGQGINDTYIFFLNQTSDSPAAIWNSTYFALSRANRVIKFADEITAVDAADAVLISRIKAEALTVRAYCHIKILSYFSPDPKDDNALGGILSNRVITTSENDLPRVSNGVFYGQIHSDLNAAIAIFNSIPLPVFGPTPVPPPNVKTYYANINLAKAMKARAYALKGDYTNAEIWANDVIANSGISLATYANYNQIWFTDSEPTDTEVIFRIKRTTIQNNQGSNMHNGWCSGKPANTGSPFYEVGRALHNILNPTNVLGAALNANTTLDIRAKAIIAPSSLVDANYATSLNYSVTDRLIIHKYGGVATGTTTAATTASGAFNNDLKIARLSEMYLIKAEARVAAGDLTGAATQIDIIRDKRFSTNQAAPVYANAAAAWQGILKERRVEFAFEGYRYIDLKRLGAIAGVALDRDAADYSAASSNYPAGNPTNLPITSFKWTLPIPQSEFNANPNVQQNFGY